MKALAALALVLALVGCGGGDDLGAWDAEALASYGCNAGAPVVGMIYREESDTIETVDVAPLLPVCTDTPILPEYVAGPVLSAWADFAAGHGLSLWLDDSAAVDYLTRRAERHYRDNLTFRKAIKNGRGDKGRDTLEAFFKHWTCAAMLKKHPQLRGHVPQSLTGTSGRA
jgi:hypothetical protein